MTSNGMARGIRIEHIEQNGQEFATIRAADREQPDVMIPITPAMRDYGTLGKAIREAAVPVWRDWWFRTYGGPS